MVSKCNDASDAYGIQKAECGVTVDSRLVHKRPGGAAIGFIRHIGEYLEAGEKVEVKVECMGKGTYGSSVRTASGSASCSSKSVSKLHKSWIVGSSLLTS